MEPYAAYLAALHLLMVVVGVPGNTLIILVTASRIRKKSVHVLIIALGSADLVACCLAPFGVHYWLNNTNYTSVVLCKGYVFTVFLSVFTSMFLTNAIAFDRYFAVCHPFKPKMSVFRATTVCVGCVIAAFFCSIPPIFAFEPRSFGVYVTVCIPLASSWLLKGVFGLIVSAFAVTAVMLIVLHLHMCIKVSRRQFWRVRIAPAVGAVAASVATNRPGTSIETNEPKIFSAQQPFRQSATGKTSVRNSSRSVGNSCVIDGKAVTLSSSQESLLGALVPSCNPPQVGSTSIQAVDNTAQSNSNHPHRAPYITHDHSKIGINLVKAEITAVTNASEQITFLRASNDSYGNHDRVPTISYICDPSSRPDAAPIPVPASIRQNNGSSSNRLQDRSSIRGVDSNSRTGHQRLSAQNNVSKTNRRGLRPHDGAAYVGDIRTNETTKMLVLSAVVFIASWLPNIVIKALPLDQYERLNPSVLLLVRGLEYLFLINHVANPFVYSLVNKRYRSLCVQYIQKLKRRMTR